MQKVQATLPVGTVIHRHYIVEDLLSQSGSGAVYLVKDQRLKHAKHNLFALKEVIALNKQEWHRFILEGALLRQLHHQALPRVYHVLKDDKHDRMYLLMEYIDGSNLETLRQQQPEQRFSWLETMNIMAPIIDAVSYLHHQQPPIIHGDIKPTNIILSKVKTRAVLVDLGIAKPSDPDLTSPAVRSGYRAPQQDGADIDQWTDVYGLGATFYTLVTGIVPVDAPSRLTQLGNGEIDPLKLVNEVISTVPTHVAQAIDQALSLDAHERFSSVEQFWERLWSLVEHPSPVPGDMPSISSRWPVVPKRTVVRPAPEAKQPPAPSVEKPGAPKQALEPSVPAPMAEHPPAPGVEKPDAPRQALEPSRPVAKQPPAPSVEKPGAPKQALEPSAPVAKQPPAPGVEKPGAPKQALEPSAPVVKQPRAPSAWKLSTLWPAARKRAVEKLVPTSGARPLRAPHVWKFATLLIVLILLIGLGVSAGFWSHALTHPAVHSVIPTPAVTSSPSPSPPTPTPTPPSVSTIYPIITGTYEGTMYDVPANVSTSMSLAIIRQSQGKISGYLKIGPELQGGGPFSGTINAVKNLQFIITDAAGHPTIYFEGTMQSATSLSGDFYQCGSAPGNQCSRVPGSYGIWNVILASPG